MKVNLPSLHLFGSGHCHHKISALHHLHPNHYFNAVSHATCLPHPFHWAHVVAHDTHMLHPLHRLHLMEQACMSYAGKWVVNHAMFTAMLVTIILGYALYVLLSAIQVTDHTSGVWALFG